MAPSPAAVPSAIPLNIVIVGDGGVGKSSITLALLRREFSHDYDPTIEDAYRLDLTIDGQQYEVNIVDTAGQEEYRGSWAEGSAREADGFIACYSIDSQTSFELVPDFLHVIRKARSLDENPTPHCTPENTRFPFLLLANKCDLPPTSRAVTAATGLHFARSAGGLFFEVSALSRANIDSAFASLVRAIVRCKTARVAYARAHPKDQELAGFNANVGELDRLAAVAKEKEGGAGRTVGVGMDEEQEISLAEARERQRSQRAGKKGGAGGLEMDRRRSMSIGGLGRDPHGYGKEEKSGCGCVLS